MAVHGVCSSRAAWPLQYMATHDVCSNESLPVAISKKVTVGKWPPRAFQRLSTPPLCSIFCVDSENGNESLAGPIFARKNKVFVKIALVSTKSRFFIFFSILVNIFCKA